MVVFACVLLAVALCTIHFIGGIWLGFVLCGRRDNDKPETVSIERLAVQLEKAEMLGRYARELSKACLAYSPQLSPAIIASAESVARCSSELQQDVESLSELVSDLNRPSKPESHDVTEVVANSFASRKQFRYEVQQYAAPCTGQTLPPAELFQPVACRNLSSSGLSFFSEELPLRQTVVLSLGTAPELRFFVSEVVRAPVAFMEGREGYMVECRFLRRVFNVYSWDSEKGAIVGDSANVPAVA